MKHEIFYSSVYRSAFEIWDFYVENLEYRKFINNCNATCMKTNRW